MKNAQISSDEVKAKVDPVSVFDVNKSVVGADVEKGVSHLMSNI